MKRIFIKDNNGDNYLIEDIKKFKNHIFKYHSIDGKGDYSLHEENGRYFTVSREFYKMIEICRESECFLKADPHTPKVTPQ